MKFFLSLRKRNWLSRGRIHRNQILKYIVIPTLSGSISKSSQARPSGSCWFPKEQIGLGANNWSPLHYFDIGFKDTSFPSHFYSAILKSFYFILYVIFKLPPNPTYHELSNPLGRVQCILYSCVVFWSVLRNPARVCFHIVSYLASLQNYYFGGVFGARGRIPTHYLSFVLGETQQTPERP